MNRSELRALAHGKTTDELRTALTARLQGSPELAQAPQPMTLTDAVQALVEEVAGMRS